MRYAAAVVTAHAVRLAAARVMRLADPLADHAADH